MKPDFKTANPAWKAVLEEAHANHQTMPQELRELVVRFALELCDLGQAHQLEPRMVAVGVAGILGQLCIVDVHGNIKNDRGVDDYLLYAEACMHIAVAHQRLQAGWTPAGGARVQ